MCRCCCKVLKCLDINTNCKAANDAQEAPSPPQDDNAGEDQNSAVGDFAAGKENDPLFKIIVLNVLYVSFLKSSRSTTTSTRYLIKNCIDYIKYLRNCNQ